jgi:hypothetical protein
MEQMRLKTVLLGALLETIALGVLLVSSAAAQSTLPNPHDDSCWSSLSALRGCQVQAYDEAQEQAQQHAQNCTSYPEFQCNDYYQPKAKAPKAVASPSSKHDATTAPTATAIPPVVPDDALVGGAN